MRVGPVEILRPISQPHGEGGEGGVGRRRDWEAFYSNDLLDFFHCYINLLKCFYNLYQ